METQCAPSPESSKYRVHTSVRTRAGACQPPAPRCQADALAQALLEASSPPPGPFPCAGIYLTELLFKALTHLAQPQPAAPTPLRRCLLPAHPALCTPGALGVGEGMGESPGAVGGGCGGWHQVSALRLCPSVCLGTWGASPFLPLGPNCKDKLQLSRGLSKRIAFCPKCQPLVWQGRCRVRTWRMWVQCPGAPCRVSHLHPHPTGGGGTGGSPSQDPTGTYGDRRVPRAAPTGTALALGTGTEHPGHSGPLHPPDPKGPRAPRRSPHLAHVELEEAPLLLHVLGQLRRRRFRLDDPCQARALLLLLHLPPVGQHGDGLGTALPETGGEPGDGPAQKGGPQGAAEVAGGWDGAGETSPRLAQSLAAALHQTPPCTGGLGGFCSGHGVAYTLVS